MKQRILKLVAIGLVQAPRALEVLFFLGFTAPLSPVFFGTNGEALLIPDTLNEASCEQPVGAVKQCGSLLLDLGVVAGAPSVLRGFDLQRVLVVDEPLLALNVSEHVLGLW